MAELINLRTVRKRAKREADAKRAEQNRLARGRPKAERQLEEARAEKLSRDLDGHRIEPGDSV
jgi:ribosomal protein S2